MPEVTKVVQNKKNNLYDLYLDGNFFLTVSEEVIVDYQLIKGKKIPSSQITELEDQQKFAEAYQIALNKLNFSMRTVGEIRQALKKAEVPVVFINQIIVKLTKQGYLNDDNFARLYLKELLQTSHYGPKMIQQKMKQKLLDPALISQTLASFSEDEQKKRISQSVAKTLAKRPVRGSANQFLEKEKLKLLRWGYDLSLINQVISEFDLTAIKDAESEQLIKEGERLWQRYRNLDPQARKQKVKLTLYRHGYQGDKINDFLANFIL